MTAAVAVHSSTNPDVLDRREHCDAVAQIEDVAARAHFTVGVEHAAGFAADRLFVAEEHEQVEVALGATRSPTTLLAREVHRPVEAHGVRSRSGDSRRSIRRRPS